MGTLLNLDGQSFGYLVVVGRGPNRGKSTTQTVRCVCGVVKDVLTRSLTHAGIKSCGCMANEMRAANNPNNNGHTKDDRYKCFTMMGQRCNNPKYNHYDYYGGRGITVSPEMSTFEGFKEVMGERPPGATIDRIDPDGNYEPGNVRWANRAEQVRNRRNTHTFDIDGEDFNIAELSRKFGKSTKFFRDRLLTKEQDIKDVIKEIT